MKISNGSFRTLKYNQFIPLEVLQQIKRAEKRTSGLQNITEENNRLKMK